MDLVADGEEPLGAPRGRLLARARELDADRAHDPPRPGAEDEHAVGEVHGLVDVVRDVHDRHAPVLAVDAEQDVLELRARERVDGRERLVEQQDLRAGDERACDRDALLHPARKLPGVLARDAAQAELLQCRLRLRDPLRARRAVVAQREHHVPAHVQPREERPAVVLEDNRDLSRGPEHRAPVEEHVPAARRGEAAQAAQERRLAAARRADDRLQLAPPDLERHVGERRRPVLGVALREALDAQDGTGAGLVPRGAARGIGDRGQRSSPTAP
jgi:hypothetical protein